MSKKNEFLVAAKSARLDENLAIAKFSNGNGKMIVSLSCPIRLDPGLSQLFHGLVQIGGGEAVFIHEAAQQGRGGKGFGLSAATGHCFSGEGANVAEKSVAVFHFFGLSKLPDGSGGCGLVVDECNRIGCERADEGIKSGAAKNCHHKRNPRMESPF